MRGNTLVKENVRTYVHFVNRFQQTYINWINESGMHSALHVLAINQIRK